MTGPTIPTNPFCDEGDAESTASNIKCVLELLRDYSFRQVEAWEGAARPSRIF